MPRVKLKTCVRPVTKAGSNAVNPNHVIAKDQRTPQTNLLKGVVDLQSVRQGSRAGGANVVS